MRNSSTANTKSRSKIYKKYDYELVMGIMSKDLFDYAVACNEYLKKCDRKESEKAYIGTIGQD